MSLSAEQDVNQGWKEDKKMSESDVLHPYLLRDVLEDAIRTMNALLEKYRGDDYDDRYCQGYRDGVAFSKEK